MGPTDALKKIMHLKHVIKPNKILPGTCFKPFTGRLLPKTIKVYCQEGLVVESLVAVVKTELTLGNALYFRYIKLTQKRIAPNSQTFFNDTANIEKGFALNCFAMIYLTRDALNYYESNKEIFVLDQGYTFKTLELVD